MKNTFKLGKIAYNGGTRKTNAVEITVELRNCGGEPTFAYVELSICGDVWNVPHTDIIMGGQCLDYIAEYRDQLTPANRDLFDTLYDLWKKYHLNGMHAGTPKQEAAIHEWEAAGNRYDYRAVCKMLKERGLYEVKFTGKTIGRMYHNELYKYGHGWVVNDLPGDVLLKVEHLIMTGEEAE